MMPVFSPRWIFLCVGFGHFLRSRRMQRLPMVFLCMNWEGLDKHGKKWCFFTFLHIKSSFLGFFLDLFEIIISIAGQDCWCGCRFLRWHTGNQWSLDQPMESFKLGESSGLVRLPSNTAGQSFQDGGKTWQNCKCYLKFCAMCDLCHASARTGQVSIPQQMNSAVRLKSWLFRVNFNQPESTWTDLNQLDPRLTRHLLTPDWPCDKSVTSLDHWPCAFGLGLGMLPRRFDAAWWVLRTSKRIQIWS